MVWAQADDLVRAVRENWVPIAVAVGLATAAVVLWRIAAARRREVPDLEKGLRENLAEYPPPPPAAGPRLSVNGVPVRLRLVVVAPTGRHQDPPTPDQVSELLDEVLSGLGQVVAADKPRVRVWPPQLSVAGFAPTFHRLVAAPGAGWMKLAGPARTASRPILLGLAVRAEGPTKLGDVVVETTEWTELLQIGR